MIGSNQIVMGQGLLNPTSNVSDDPSRQIASPQEVGSNVANGNIYQGAPHGSDPHYNPPQGNVPISGAYVHLD